MILGWMTSDPATGCRIVRRCREKSERPASTKWMNKLGGCGCQRQLGRHAMVAWNLWMTKRLYFARRPPVEERLLYFDRWNPVPEYKFYFDRYQPVASWWPRSYFDHLQPVSERGSTLIRNGCPCHDRLESVPAWKTYCMIQGGP